jgi:hypothetical protein
MRVTQDSNTPRLCMRYQEKFMYFSGVTGINNVLVNITFMPAKSSALPGYLPTQCSMFKVHQSILCMRNGLRQFLVPLFEH